jgi:hypothetical protein
MDEFLYCEEDINICNILKRNEYFAQIQMNHVLFGSNGLSKQPKYVIPNFIRREIPNGIGSCKYIINSNYEFTSLNVHHATFLDEDNLDNGKFVILDFNSNIDNPLFTLNHYNCQSKEFWENVKCTRGDSDYYRVRVMSDFNNYDKNDVEDNKLFEQNRYLYESVLL